VTATASEPEPVVEIAVLKKVDTSGKDAYQKFELNLPFA